MVLERARGLGLSGITLAMAYHQARDVVPHAGEKPRLRFRRDGVFFAPDPSVWGSCRLQPQMQSRDERDAAARLRERARDGEAEAWVVFLHNTGLGERHPETTTLTCFGDRLLSNLCPANPDVADYAVALAADVSRLGMDVLAEALSYQTFGHGHHHERSFAPVGAGDEFLLSLCFCAHCVRVGESGGVDMAGLRREAADRLDSAYAGAAALPATTEALVDALGPDLSTIIALRNRTVAELSARVARAVHGNGRRFGYMDLTGAVLGYDDGRPAGAPAAEQSWRIGVSAEALADRVDDVSILGYAADPERLRSDVASYVRILGSTPLRVILRPGFPDTVSAAHLTQKVQACLSAGAQSVDFYNYGMYPQHVLDRIGAVDAAPDLIELT